MKKVLKFGLLMSSMSIGFSASAIQYNQTGDWKGGLSGRWGDPNNWYGGVVPDSQTNARFWMSPGETLEVEVDGDFTPRCIVFGHKSNEYYGERRPTIILKRGTGSSSSISTADKVYTQINNDLNVVLDGIELESWGLTFGSTNVFRLVNNAKVTASGATAFNNMKANTVVVDQSSLELYSLEMGADSRLVLSNSFLQVNAKSITFGDGGSSEIVKSKIRAGVNVVSELIVPTDGSTLETFSSAGVYYPGGEGARYEIAGMVFVTNAGGAFGSWSAKSSYGGRGRVYARQFIVPNSVAMEIDLSVLGLGYQLYSNKENQNSRLTMYGPLTLASFGNWTSERQARYDVEGDLAVDTLDCFNQTDIRTFTLRGLYPHASSTLTLQGGGSGTVGFNDVLYRWRQVVLKDGTDLSFYSTPGDTSYSMYPRLFTSGLVLGAGSTLSVTAGDTVVDVTDEPEIAAGATLAVSLPANPVVGRCYPALCAPPTSNLGSLTLTETAAVSGWSLVKREGCVFYTDGNAARDTTAFSWTGAVDGKIGTSGNWYGSSAPSGGANVVLSGPSNGLLDNDVDMTGGWNTLTIQNGGPWRITGKQLIVSGSLPTRTFVSTSDLPVVFDCDFLHNGKYASFGTSSNSYVRLNGTTTIQKVFIPRGDIRIGGSLTCAGLQFEPAAGSSQATRLTICRGGTMTVSNQSASDVLSNKAVGILIEDGASMTVSGGTDYIVGVNGFRHLVNGRFTCRVPFSARCDNVLGGTGRVDIASVKSTTANATYSLRGGVYLVPGAWTTVTADDADHYARLLVETRATLGATGDWTYGPAVDVSPSTTAADRALIIQNPLSKLTVNTQNPDSRVSHQITFADPIVGFGRLVKVGGGTLVLASSANAVTGGVEIVEGAIAWTAAQNFTKLDLKLGVALRFGFAEGAPIKAQVASDVDLTGVSLLPIDGSADSCDKYATVLEATGGAKIVGTPQTSTRWRYRVVDGRLLQAKRRQGLMMLVR